MQTEFKTQEIILKDKKGNKKKAILEYIEIYFEPALWNAIKEWAGIYDIGIKWDKKWSDMDACYTLRHFCPSIKAMTQKAFRETGRDHPEIIRRMVWKDINTYIEPPEYEKIIGYDFNGNERYHYIHKGTYDNPKYLLEKERNFINRKYKFLMALHKRFPTFSVPPKLKVGTVVRWGTTEAGRITKITKTSISFTTFKTEFVRFDSPVPNSSGWETLHRWIEAPDDKVTTITSFVRRFDYGEWWPVPDNFEFTQRHYSDN
jgi:hypothetical protein